MVAKSTALTPAIELNGEVADGYVDNLTAILRMARLNNYYPKTRAILQNLSCMASKMHRGLYAGLEIDARSGLPTYREWTRVQTDRDIASEALDGLPSLATLQEKAAAAPDSIFGKQLLKYHYYTDIKDKQLASLSDMDVALRRIEPENKKAYFRVVLDKLDVRGLFVRYTIEVSQEDDYWNKPIATLDQDDAEHTDSFRSLIYSFSSLDSEFTFSKLAALGGLEVERVVKGTIGPIYFPGMPAPEPIEAILESHPEYIASFSVDMAATDLVDDKDNDPMDDLMADSLSEDAKRGYEHARGRFGYKVFKDRKFVTTRDLMAPLKAYCEASGTKNIIYRTRR